MFCPGMSDSDFSPHLKKNKSVIDIIQAHTMHIINRTISDRCIDGAVSCEYSFSEPVDDSFLEVLQVFGTVTKRNLGSLVLFTCVKEQMKLKGMTGDTLILGTVLKADLESADRFIEDVVRLYMHRKADLEGRI